MSDTVGFISDLPTELVAAFRATLEEVLEADVILHVRDISHAETEAQKTEVMAILTTLGVARETPLIEVWNKIDQLPGDMADAMRMQATRQPDTYVTSALTGEGMDGLLDKVLGAVREPKTADTVRLGWQQAAARSYLHELGVVQTEREAEDGWVVDVTWTARDAERFAAFQRQGAKPRQN